MNLDKNDDPRKPNDIKIFKQREIPPEELPIDTYSILALILGMVGLMFRVYFILFIFNKNRILYIVGFHYYVILHQLRLYHIMHKI